MSLLVGGLASMTSIPAQPQEPLRLEKFSERLYKDVPVSGRMLVGASVMSSEVDDVSASLIPRLLWRGGSVESASEPLCVTFVSRDGQYYGEGSLSSATLGGLVGPVRVQGGGHSSDIAAYLSKLPEDELAVLARTGDCRLGVAHGKTTVHIVDRRDAEVSVSQVSAADQFTLTIMLNSMTYTLAVEVSIQGITRHATCRALDDARRNKAFTTLCTLTVPNVATVADVVIRRRRYERWFDPIQFKLAWSAL